MVIDTNSINPAQPGKRNGGTDSAALDKKAASANPKASTNKSSNSSSDTVELSSQARTLGKIERALASLPEVDEARVEQVRQQIADGSYQVDANSIAANILRDDQSF
ncbi:MAG: flagellar biosynthesis anti-sigma factor FlgM [Gammaproteobacteria bacterium]|nr:flagellar biosynthesis anti-sigma factor FlgM [Gammaproteobacteria bacterium]